MCVRVYSQWKLHNPTLVRIRKVKMQNDLLCTEIMSDRVNLGLDRCLMIIQFPL